jgi:hypothetical protein
MPYSPIWMPDLSGPDRLWDITSLETLSTSEAANAELAGNGC